MTVYEDGKKKEEVQMNGLRSKTEMHELMVKKGFVKKSAEVIAQQTAARKQEEEDAKKKFFAGREQHYQNLRDQKTARERDARLAQRENRWGKRREERELEKTERELMGKTMLPKPSSLLQWYGAAIAAVLILASYAGVRSGKRRNRSTAATMSTSRSPG